MKFYIIFHIYFYIIAQFFACFSQKLAPARKNSTDWSARSARFCNSDGLVMEPISHFVLAMIVPACLNFLPDDDDDVDDVDGDDFTWQ